MVQSQEKIIKKKGSRYQNKVKEWKTKFNSVANLSSKFQRNRMHFFFCDVVEK